MALYDVRHAGRALRRAPLYMLVAMLSISLGIGANTTVFSWLDALVLHPFPGVRDPDHVVGLEVRGPSGDGWPVSFPTYRQWRASTTSFRGMAAWTIWRVSVRETGEPASTSLLALATSGNYVDVLGGGTYAGRALSEADEHAVAPVVVLGYAYWMRRYGGDRSVLGRTLYVNGEPLQVIGVAAPHFIGTYVGVVPDLFVPITLEPRLAGTNLLDDRSNRVFQVVARLAPGVSLAQASAELDPLARRLAAGFGDRPITGAKIKDIRTQYLGGVVLPLFTAMLVVTLLLLTVGCANVTSLLLLRASARRHELAVRLALGASRRRIVSLVGAESLVLSAGGGLFGVGVAVLGRGVLYQLMPMGPLPLTLAVPLDRRVLLFAVALATLVTIACGLLPALRATRVPPANALRQGGRTLAGGPSRLRDGIVAGQLAFALLCLATAGQFVNGLRTAAGIDPGFTDAEHVLLINTNLAAARLTESTGPAVLRAIMDRARALPGVRAVSAATMVPLGFGGRQRVDLKTDGYDPRADEDVSATRVAVGPGYAVLMGIRVLAGRDVTDQDRAHSQPVALVNEALARHFWPGQSALGHRVDVGHGWATIVGLLKDGKYGSLTEPPQAVVYVPLDQWYQPSVTLHVRTTGDPYASLEPVRKALQHVNVDLPALQPRTLAEHARTALFVQRTGASVLTAFSTVALVLSVIGLYGALAVAVGQRAREFGIRVALGASSRAVAWAVLRRALLIAVGGIAGGILLALAATRVAHQQLVSAGPLEPRTLVLAAAVLLATALLAAYVPARRAIRIDPAVVLRGE